MSVEAILAKLYLFGEFSTEHAEPWRNQVADDLNQLVGRAIWTIETDGDETDLEFGAAVVRIVERVAQSEEIEPKPKMAA